MQIDNLHVVINISTIKANFTELGILNYSILVNIYMVFNAGSLAARGSVFAPLELLLIYARLASTSSGQRTALNTSAYRAETRDGI